VFVESCMKVSHFSPVTEITAGWFEGFLA